MNGAAARLVHEGDTIIVISYAMFDEAEVKNHQPKVAIMDENNKIKEMLGVEPEATVY